MATSSNRAGGSAGRKPPRPAADAANRQADDAPAGAADGASGGTAPTGRFDSALDAWAGSLAREQLAWQLGACRALLQSAKALREAQIDAAQRADVRHQEAAERLGSQRGNATELGRLQLELARANAQEAAAHWSRLHEIGLQGGAQWLEQMAAGFARCSSALWEGWAGWSQRQAQWSAHPELAEAEVEQVADTVSASPLVWPAQEAARQAMGLAASTWNDWLSWGQRESAAANRPH